MGHRNLKVGNINSRARGAQPARRRLSLAIGAGLAAMCVALPGLAQQIPCPLPVIAASCPANVDVVNTDVVGHRAIGGNASSTGGASARLDNSGSITWHGNWYRQDGYSFIPSSGVLFAQASSLQPGGAFASVRNSGSVSVSDFDGGSIVRLLSAGSSSSAEIVNEGELRARGMNRVTGIYIRQVAGRLQSLATDPAHPTGSLMADFGSPAAVRNRGAISLSGEGGVIGIEGGGVFGELLIENSGAISIDNTYTEESDEVSAGIAATGYGDINIVNDAEITITANDSATSESHATTQGIFFSERSLGTEAVAALQQGGLSNVYRWVGNTLHGYDHALDMTSRVTIRTSADITASGADAHGIFGLLGWEVHDAFGAGGYVLGLPVSSNGYYGRLGNGGTSALIEVAEGATAVSYTHLCWKSGSYMANWQTKVFRRTV